MYTLMVSKDAGNSYTPDEKAETMSMLDSRMDQLDKKKLRWFLQDEDDCQVFGYRICEIHKQILAAVMRSNGQISYPRKVD